MQKFIRPLVLGAALIVIGGSASAAEAASIAPARAAAASVPPAVAVSGQVFDARVLSTPRGASVVIPDGLHRIVGARVSVTFSSGTEVDAVTNRAGYFNVARPAGTPAKTTATVSVHAPGFGTWRETGVPAALPHGNYPILTVLLSVAAHSQSYPRNPTISGRAGPASGRASPRPLPGTPAPSAPSGSAQNIASSRHAAAATGGCTGWFSNVLPPPTIRVYNVSTDSLQTYDFEYYVENVLPNEWIASWPAQSLDAGAMAVKTYGWYWVNNWRGGSFDGTCYDVQGGTSGGSCDVNYQCFIPGSAVSTATDAVESTWSQVAQQNGAVFEASFNSGFSSDTCGDDDGSPAPGDEMSQWGTDACANDGYGWSSIFTKYYFPNVRFITTSGPIAATPAPFDDNLINMFEMGGNGHSYQSYEKSNGSFTDWAAIAGSFPGGSLQGSIAALPAPASDKLINAFAMGSNGHLYQSYQKSSGSFTSWAAVAGSFPGGFLEGSISALAAPASDNLINVFALGSNGHLYQSYEKSNGSFTGWAAIAGSFPGGSLQGSISALAAPASDNLINVFALGSNGHLYQSYEKSNGSFTGWAAVAGSFPGGSLQGSISALAAPASDNLINVFALGSNGQLYQSYEKSNGSFTGWAAVAGSFPGGSLQGSIAALAAPASSNLINVFAMGSNGQLYQSYEKSNGSFTGWAAVAGSFPGGFLEGSISALPAPASDNLINVFGLGSNGQLYQSYEKSSGSFTGWAAIAGTLST
jgi:hypothetical protein